MRLEEAGKKEDKLKPHLSVGRVIECCGFGLSSGVVDHRGGMES